METTAQNVTTAAYDLLCSRTQFHKSMCAYYDTLFQSLPCPVTIAFESDGRTRLIDVIAFPGQAERETASKALKEFAQTMYCYHRLEFEKCSMEVLQHIETRQTGHQALNPTQQ